MRPCKSLNGILIASAAMLLSGPAPGATEHPIHPYISYNVMWDSNIFRLSGKEAAQSLLGSTDTATTMNRLDVGIDGDIPISRQHFITQFNLNRSRFDRFSFLNYTGHDVLLKWNWQVGDLWSGDLGYTDEKALASYVQFQRPIQNLAMLSNRFLDADYALYPHWHLRGGVYRREIAYSADTQHTNNVTIDVAKAGLRFVSRANNTMGLQLKAIDGTYPNRQVVATSVVDNSYHQLELTAETYWRYSGNTYIRGAAGYVNRTYPQLSVRNFHGLVGHADVHWDTGGPLAWVFSVWHRVGAYQNLISSYVVADGGSIDPTWTVTPKLATTGELLYETLSYQGEPGFLLNQQALREDTLRGVKIGLSYTPFQRVTLGADYQWQYRTSNYATYDYRDNMITARLRINFL